MSCLVVAAALWTSGAVSPTWTSFAAARAANDLTQAPIVDFSYAGYEHGEIGIPAATGVRYDVTAYGAVPNDDVDDRTAVDAAIRTAEAAAEAALATLWKGGEQCLVLVLVSMQS